MSGGNKLLPSGHKSFTVSHCGGGGEQNSLVLLEKKVHVDSLSNCELMIGESRLVHQQHVALTLDKTPRSVSQPALADFMFSCCSSLGLRRRSALRVAPVASGSPGETSEPVGNEGPTEEKVCRGGRACCSALTLVDLLACALASS